VFLLALALRDTGGDEKGHDDTREQNRLGCGARTQDERHTHRNGDVAHRARGLEGDVKAPHHEHT
jgi:hypothetical protein